MTKLEEEIFQEMIDVPDDLNLTGFTLEKYQASRAAEVAKRYIEKAFADGTIYGRFEGQNKHWDQATKKWLKENGVTP